MIEPYTDEAVSSWVRRMELRGLLPPGFNEAPSDDLAPSPRLIAAAQNLEEGAGLVLERSGLHRHWRHADVDDLMERSDHWQGKACRECLEEDARRGRDQYLRREWLFVWRTTCSSHGLPLHAITSSVLAPVIVAGERTRRVKLLREVDLRSDPFLKPGRATPWHSRKVPPAYVTVFEEACMAALGGAPLDHFWCCGSRWTKARTTFLDLADLLLSPGKSDQEQPVRMLPNGIETPFWGNLRFGVKAMRSLSPAWQSSCMHALATVLADPTRFELVVEDAFFGGYLGGRASARRQTGPLGRLALKDPLAIVLASAADPDLHRFLEGAARWPSPFLLRARTAAAIALTLT